MGRQILKPFDPSQSSIMIYVKFILSYEKKIRKVNNIKSKIKLFLTKKKKKQTPVIPTT